MGVGAGLYMYVVVVQKFTFVISFPDEFLFFITRSSLHGALRETHKMKPDYISPLDC